MNRPWQFRPRRPQFPTAGRGGAQRPSPAATARGWEPHETPGNWTLRAPFAKPPAGTAINRPRRFRRRRPQFSTAGRPGAQRPRPRPAFVGGSRTKPPGGGCAQPPPAVSPHEGRSFQLQAVSGPTAPRPRPSPVGGNRTKRPATGRCGLHLQSPLAGAAPNRPRRFRH